MKIYLLAISMLCSYPMLGIGYSAEPVKSTSSVSAEDADNPISIDYKEDYSKDAGDGKIATLRRVLPITASSFVIPTADCSLLHQNNGDAACELYSFLGAALKITAMREKLNSIVRIADGKFFVNLTEYNSTAKEYFVPIKNLYINKMNPSSNEWINLFTQCYYKFNKELGGNKETLSAYSLTVPVTNDDKDYAFNYIFGTTGYIIGDPHGDINKYDNVELAKDSLTKDNEANISFLKDGNILLKKDNKWVTIYGKDKIIALANMIGHAESMYYDSSSEKWVVFNNQAGNCSSDIKKMGKYSYSYIIGTKNIKESDFVTAWEVDEWAEQGGVDDAWGAPEASPKA